MKHLRLLLVPVLALALASAPRAQDPEALATRTVSALEQEIGAASDAALTALASEYRDAMDANATIQEELDSKLAAAAEDAKADIQTEIDAAVAQVDALVERQRSILSAMDERELDTKELRTALFEETGQITDKGLSAEAAADLIGTWIAKGKKWIEDNGPALIVKTILFLAILLVFRVLAKIAGKAAEKATSGSKLKFSTLLKKLVVNTTRNLVFLVGVLIALDQVGVKIGPILGAIGIVGFVLGFALQDTLSNFAAGIMILLYRPYDVGDFVTAGGVTGKVENMTLVSTTFLTPDNQKMIVPNSAIWGGVIQNVTANDTRRVDLVMGVGYGDDLDKVEAVLEEVVNAHPNVLEDPAPVIKVHELADSSVNFVVRPWCRTSDYWDVYWDLTKTLKQRFDAEGINIPFPQRDVHLFPTNGAELQPT